jgi:perosamine synthetase
MNQGQDGRYNHVTLGFNYRMTEMQAALGCSQLKHVSRTLSEKERIARRYDDAFRDVTGIEAPPRPDYATSQSWYMYSVRVRDLSTRDRVVAALGEEGIETRLGFPPVHIQPYYRETFGWRPEDLPVSLRAWQRKIDIPAWPGLPESSQDEVVQIIKETLKRS